ncbi:MAG: cyclic lactone autoinducer peptide [Eubacteriales bacterium]
MKKFLMKYGHILSAFTLIITTHVANRNCLLIFHQPKLPDTAKNLRKF